MDRGSWRATVHGATVHGVCKELDTTEQLTVSSEKCFFFDQHDVGWPGSSQKSSPTASPQGPHSGAFSHSGNRHLGSAISGAPIATRLKLLQSPGMLFYLHCCT